LSRTVFLDANVVLRILFGEPPELAEEAFRAVGQLREEGARLILPGIALAEVVWTLERRAKVARVDIAAELVDFLTAFGIAVGGPRVARCAGALRRAQRALRRRRARHYGAGCRRSELLSFDEHFDQLRVRHLKPVELAAQAVGEPGPPSCRRPRRRR